MRNQTAAASWSPHWLCEQLTLQVNFKVPTPRGAAPNQTLKHGTKKLWTTCHRTLCTSVLHNNGHCSCDSGLTFENFPARTSQGEHLVIDYSPSAPLHFIIVALSAMLLTVSKLYVYLELSGTVVAVALFAS